MKALLCVLIMAALPGPQQALKPLDKQIAFLIEHKRTDQLGSVLDQLSSASEAGLVPDLWRLYDHLSESGDAGHAVSVAQGICRLGSREDLEALVQRRRELPSIHDQQQLLRALCLCRIGQQLQEPGRQAAASSAEPMEEAQLPEFLAGADSEMKNAFRRYQALGLTFQETFQSFSRDSAAIPPNWPIFLETVEDLVLQEEGASWRGLLPFHWDGPFGTGRTGPLLFFSLRYNALLMSLLDEGEPRLALSILMQILPTRRIGIWRPSEWLSWLKLLSRMSGEDGEELLWGGVLSEHPHLLSYLSGGGTSQFGAGLLKLAPLVDRMPKDWIRSSFIEASANWIRPGPSFKKAEKAGSSLDLADWPPRPQHFASEEVQRELLGWINRWIEQDGDGMLPTGTWVLSRLLRPESLPALRRAYASPYAEIRERARAALQAMGEKNLDLPPLEPYRFRFIVNGQTVSVRQATYQAPGIAGQVSIDEQGVLRIDHDKLAFSDPAEEIIFRANPITSTDSAWFLVRSAIPQTSEIQDLMAETTALRIRFSQDPLAAGLSGRPLQVNLSHEEDGGFHPVIQWESVLEGDLSFQLTPGLYRRLQVLVPGAARWEMERLEVPPQGTDVEVLLLPGADLKFSIQAPKHLAEYRLGFFYELFRDGAALGNFWVAEGEPRSHDGLPVGSYRLAVLSSKEEEEWQKRAGMMISLQAGCAHAGKEIRFEIRPGGGAEIDLGTIELAPGPAAPKR